MAKTLGERMVIYRAEHDLSQQELADKCKVSKQTIFSIESEQQTPSRLTRAKIELVIGEAE